MARDGQGTTLPLEMDDVMACWKGKVVVFKCSWSCHVCSWKPLKIKIRHENIRASWRKKKKKNSAHVQKLGKTGTWFLEKTLLNAVCIPEQFTTLKKSLNHDNAYKLLSVIPVNAQHQGSWKKLAKLCFSPWSHTQFVFMCCYFCGCFVVVVCVCVFKKALLQSLKHRFL